MPKVIQIPVYGFTELSNVAKRKNETTAWELIENQNFEIFIDNVKAGLAEATPNSSLKIRASLTYCQGDGVNIEGIIALKDLANIGNIDKPIPEELQTAIDNNSVEFKLTENHRYAYSCKNYDLVDCVNNAYRSMDELFPDAYTSLTQEKTDEYIDIVADIMRAGFKVLMTWEREIERAGYECVYDIDDTDVEYWWDDDWFFENGELATEFVKRYEGSN